MTQKKSYSRYFIILQEDEKGYSLASDKLPSGYTKLEMKNDKCKISFYVQNLKKQHAPYYLMLVCSKKDIKKVIKLAEMNIDDHGRAEVSYEFPVDNIANTAIAADKITGAAIVKFMGSEIVPIMSGFASAEVPEWRSFVVVEEKNREEKQEETIFDKYEQKIETIKAEERNTLTANDIKIVEEPGKQKVKSKLEDDDKTQIADKAQIKLEEEKEIKVEEGIKLEIEAEIKKEKLLRSNEEDKKLEIDNSISENTVQKNKDGDIKEAEEENKTSEPNRESEGNETEQIEEVNEYEEAPRCKKKDNEENKHHQHHTEENKYPVGKTGRFFETLAEGLKEIKGVCSEVKRCKWYRIPVKDFADMSDISNYNRYTVIHYPMINYFPYIQKHGHYLVGYKCDPSGKMKYVVYAIPGRKSHIDQPCGGRTGFVTWVPLRDGDEREESMGYWLMFYDFRNSVIVIPIK